MTSPRSQIRSDKTCCMNCRFMGWQVGVGQGVRCWNPENRANPPPGLKAAGSLPLIPNLEFLCEKFAWRSSTGEDGNPNDRDDKAAAP